MYTLNDMSVRVVRLTDVRHNSRERRRHGFGLGPHDVRSTSVLTRDEVRPGATPKGRRSQLDTVDTKVLTRAGSWLRGTGGHGLLRHLPHRRTRRGTSEPPIIADVAGHQGSAQDTA